MGKEESKTMLRTGFFIYFKKLQSAARSEATQRMLNVLRIWELNYRKCKGSYSKRYTTQFEKDVDLSVSKEIAAA